MKLQEEMTKTHIHPLEHVLESRIAIIDGAMGTTIRNYGMTEADIRGERFKDAKKGSAEQRRPVHADAAADDRRHSSAVS